MALTTSRWVSSKCPWRTPALAVHMAIIGLPLRGSPGCCDVCVRVSYRHKRKNGEWAASCTSGQGQPLSPASLWLWWAASVCVLIHCSRVQLFATLWAVSHQAPFSMGILQARTLERVAMPPPGDPPDPGIEPTSLMSTVLAGGFFTTSTTGDALRWAESSPKIWNLLICNMATGTRI